MPRVLRETWEDLQGLNELQHAGAEEVRCLLRRYHARPDDYSLGSLLRAVVAPYGPPLYRPMPALVGHVLYWLAAAAEEAQPAVCAVTVFRLAGGACTVSDWLTAHRWAYTDKKGKSTIPLILGDPPKLPAC